MPLAVLVAVRVGAGVTSVVADGVAPRVEVGVAGRGVGLGARVRVDGARVLVNGAGVVAVARTVGVRS